MAKVQERRDVVGFDEIVLEGSGSITLIQGDQDGLVIETEESALPRLKSVVRDGRLYLGLKNWWDVFFMFPFPEVRYQVTMRELHGVRFSGSGKLRAGRVETDRLQLRISGAGDMSVEDLRARDLEVGVSGSGKAALGGAVETLSINISGSGDIRAENMECAEARVRISGSGDVRLRADARLDVIVSGSGNVGYIGHPRVNRRISGAGKVREIQPA